MNSKKRGRREFLQESAALAGLAVVPVHIAAGTTNAGGEAQASKPTDVNDPNSLDALLYGRRSRFVTTVRMIEGTSHPDMRPPLPNPSRHETRTPVAEMVGIITPASLHYTMQHDYGIPDINPAEHKLMIHGMVDRQLAFTVDDLKRLPFVSRIHFVECDGNRPNPTGKSVTDTHGRMSCSEWTGVPLSVLLQEVGIKNGAKWIISEGAEAGKHQKSLPISKALDDVIVAYGQNGEPVRPDQGFPMRLIVPGFQGIENVKWLRRIKVADQPYHAYRDDLPGYRGRDPTTDSNDFGPKSVITFPSGTHQLPGRGSYVVSGLAWSGGGAIQKVEVSADGGKTYQEAQFAGPRLPKAFTRFYLPWRWNGEESVLQSRCVDERGQIQPTEAEFARYWGLTRAQLYQTMSSRGHCNWIQAWRVNADGRVTNGLPSLAAAVDAHE